MDFIEWNVAYLHSAILHSNDDEQTITACNEVDKPYKQWKKSTVYTVCKASYTHFLIYSDKNNLVARIISILQMRRLRNREVVLSLASI